MRKILGTIYAWTAIEILTGIVAGIIVAAICIYGGACLAYLFAHFWE